MDKCTNNRNFADRNYKTMKDREKREKKGGAGDRRRTGKKDSTVEREMIRLNKYISNSGVCSRRDADSLISAGEIKVNGQTITDLGTKVSPDARVEYKGKILNPEKK